MMLTGLRHSLGFLKTFARSNGADFTPRRLSLPTAAGAFDIDVFRPPTPTAPAAPTIVVQHGMSPTAASDPRFVRLCGALAGQGYRVVAPHLPTLGRLEITPQTVEELVAVFNGLHRHPMFASTGPVAVFGVSFAGSPAIIAAADPRVRLPISSVVSLGSYSDLAGALEHLLSPPDPRRPRDDCGRLLFLWNFFDDLFPNASRRVYRLLERALTENFANRPVPPADAADEFGEPDARLWRQLSDPQDAELRRRCLDIVRTRRDRTEAMSPLRYLDGLQAPIWLLHGRSDDVIPADESRRLEGELVDAASPVQALYTEAFTHADPRSGKSVRRGWEFLQLAIFLARWMSSVRTATAVRRPAAAPRPPVAAFVPRPRPVRWKGTAHVPTPAGL